MQREHRAMRATEIRATPDSRSFEAVVLRYNVVDDYDTIFDPGVFKASLETRMPRITWAHDWSEPLGRYVDYKDSDEGLTLIGEFDDFDAVPMARRAHAQLLSGTIDQFSVGFRAKETYDDDDKRKHFRSADLDEAALVLVGAVPGTELVSVRSAKTGGRRQVPMEYLDHLAEQVTSGKMTKDAALLAIDLASGDSSAPVAPVDTNTNVSEPDHGELAGAEDALAALGL